VTYQGFVPGEDETLLGGSLAYGGDAQGAVDAGDYRIRPEGLTAANYRIDFVDGTLRVDPRAIALVGVTVDDKVYDGTVDATVSRFGRLDGVLGDDRVSFDAGLARVVFEDPNAGSGKSIRVQGAGLAGADAGNYRLHVPRVTADILPAALTVTARDDEKTYDGEAYAGGNGVTYQGFVAGEDVNVLGGRLTYGGDAQGAVNAGEYRIRPGGLVSGNYAIEYVDGRLTVDPRMLSIAGLVVPDKIVDGSLLTPVEGEPRLENVVAGDAVRLQGDPPVGRFLDARPGEGKPVRVEGLALAGSTAPNYRLPEPYLLSGDLLAPAVIGDVARGLDSTAIENPWVTGSPWAPARASTERGGRRVGGLGPMLKVVDGGIRLPEGMLVRVAGAEPEGR